MSALRPIGPDGPAKWNLKDETWCSRSVSHEIYEGLEHRFLIAVSGHLFTPLIRQIAVDVIWVNE